MADAWYQKSGTEIVEQIGSDLQKGLTEQEAAERLAKNGPNELKGKQRHFTENAHAIFAEHLF